MGQGIAHPNKGAASSSLTKGSKMIDSHGLWFVDVDAKIRVAARAADLIEHVAARLRGGRCSRVPLANCALILKRGYLLKLERQGAAVCPDHHLYLVHFACLMTEVRKAGELHLAVPA
jgi:hypothetical protein